eukprot:6221851-Pyramimonas_sp.AAC.1
MGTISSAIVASPDPLALPMGFLWPPRCCLCFGADAADAASPVSLLGRLGLPAVARQDIARPSSVIANVCKMFVEATIPAAAVAARVKGFSPG